MLAAAVRAGPAEPRSRLPGGGHRGNCRGHRHPRATSRAPAAALRAAQTPRRGKVSAPGQVCSASFLGFGEEQPACAQQITNGAPALARVCRQRGQPGERVRDRRIRWLLMKHRCCGALPSRGLRRRGRMGRPGEQGWILPQAGVGWQGRGGAARGMQAGVGLAAAAG